MPDSSPLLDHMVKVRQAMDARDNVLLNRVTQDYLNAYKELKVSIKALQEAAEAAGVSGSQLSQLAAMQSLLEGVKKEIARFAGLLGDNISQAMKLEIEMAGIDALGMTQAMLPGFDPARLVREWARLDTRTVENLFGFLDPNGPLYADLRLRFPEAVAQQVRDRLMSGFVQGMHSNEIAGIISKAVGIGLDWALSMARTSIIWAYRASTQQTYLANSKYIKGWYWISARDRRVCMSCVALHGSLHPLSEMQNDHHQGRCFSVPATVSYAELGLTGVEEYQPKIPSGESWFKSLDERRQRELMGGAKWRAWKDGAFGFDQLTTTYVSPIYGPMKREASLKEILGDKAQLYANTAN